jgi:uncharacterized protein YacL
MSEQSAKRFRTGPVLTAIGFLLTPAFAALLFSALKVYDGFVMSTVPILALLCGVTSATVLAFALAKTRVKRVGLALLLSILFVPLSFVLAIFGCSMASWVHISPR